MIITERYFLLESIIIKKTKEHECEIEKMEI